MSSSLDDPALYTAQLLSLANRSAGEGRDDELMLQVASLRPHASELGRRLAHEVSQARYTFQPLTARDVILQGKTRRLYIPCPLDAVVWGALSRCLAEAFEGSWGDHLFSYRKGRSQWTACRAFLAYLRQHEQRCESPAQRGVFVLRRDVRKYGENIAVHDESSLWSTLASLLHGKKLGFKNDPAAFLRAAMRPAVRQQDGTAHPLSAGVPTGLALQAIACNAYLLPLDRALSSLDGGFYARFGDDLLFAHPDLATVEHAASLLNRHLGELELSFNAQKTADIWLTLPGRSHPKASAFSARRRFAYLGFDVGFDGATLRADKRRALWISLKNRLRQADAILKAASDAERLDVLCSVVRAALDPKDTLGDRYAPWLRFDVMARGDLTQLDHHIALRIAEQVTGVRGVRAFRKVTPRMLYQQYALPSLVAQWDSARKLSRGRP